MKRTLLLAAILMATVAVKAQSPAPYGAFNTSPFSFGRMQPVPDTNQFRPKWSLTKYAAISTGFIGFRGGSGSFLSAPMGLQLSRQLTNNVSAFGGVSITPSYFYTNSAFYQPGLKNGGFMSNNRTGNFGAYPSAQVGVMYTNDQRTFSISGSVSVTRTNGFGGGYYPPF